VCPMQCRQAIWSLLIAALVGCVSVVGLAEYDIVQIIPIFYDCSCDRATEIFVLQLAEEDAAYGWRLYTNEGNYMLGTSYTISPARLMYLDLCGIIDEHAPPNVAADETAWGLLAIDLLNDPEARDALLVRVEYSGPSGGLGSWHVAYPMVTCEHGGKSHIGTFYRATPGNHDTLIVVNSSREEIAYAVTLHDWDGEVILAVDFQLGSLASVRHSLRDIRSSPANDSYQGALTVSVNPEHTGALLCVLAHSFENELFQYELLP